MPNKTPPHPDCVAFGKLLRETFAKAHLQHPMLIGQLVADAQEFPERETLPYHPAVVQSWFEGTSVPEPMAFAAISDLLEDVAPANFEDCYEAALLSAPRSTEVGIVLRHRLNSTGTTYKDLGKLLQENGAPGKNDKPWSGGAISYWCSGTNDVPDHVLPKLDRLLPPQNDERLLLGRLHELNLPAYAALLAKAAATDDIHRALRYLRRAVDMSGAEMAREISARLPEGHSVSAISVRNWELLAHKPHSHVPSARVFGDLHPIDVYGDILAAHGHGDWVKEHSAHLHALYDKSIKNHFMPPIFSFSESVLSEPSETPSQVRS